eukprot:3112787-Amphidinium_carterae.1
MTCTSRPLASFATRTSATGAICANPDNRDAPNRTWSRLWTGLLEVLLAPSVFGVAADVLNLRPLSTST